MVNDSNLIIESVNFLEKQINLHVELANQAIDAQKYDSFEKERKIITTLIDKLSLELKNMDDFLDKHKKVLINETKNLLSNHGKKKQIHLRCIPTHQRRSEKSKRI